MDEGWRGEWGGLDKGGQSRGGGAGEWERGGLIACSRVCMLGHMHTAPMCMCIHMHAHTHMRTLSAPACGVHVCFAWPFGRKVWRGLLVYGWLRWLHFVASGRGSGPSKAACTEGGDSHTPLKGGLSTPSQGGTLTPQN